MGEKPASTPPSSSLFWKTALFKVVLPSCIFLCFLLMYSFSASKDFTQASKELYHAESHAKELTEEQKKVKEKIAKAAEIQAKQHAHEYNNEFHVLFIFVKLKDNPKLSEKLNVSLGSMFKHASFAKHENLHMHFVCDEDGKEQAQAFLQKHISHPKFTLKVHFHDVDFFVSELRTKIARVQSVLGNNHPRYDDIIFLLSLSLHKILPTKINKIIQLDLDLKFTTNVRSLWDEFDKFSRSNLFGMAHENQPVYRHLLWKYRKENPGTAFGDSVLDGGNPGYNSGVLLLHLHRIRTNELYNQYLEPENLHKLVQKFHFTGHLGDQDFYTLLSFEQPDLFHTLDCGWNRQLCEWWRNKGYEKVFHKYFDCRHESIKIWHGNCDTPFPE